MKGKECHNSALTLLRSSNPFPLLAKFPLHIPSVKYRNNVNRVESLPRTIPISAVPANNQLNWPLQDAPANKGRRTVCKERDNKRNTNRVHRRRLVHVPSDARSENRRTRKSLPPPSLVRTRTQSKSSDDDSIMRKGQTSRRWMTRDRRPLA